ncbi:hypothetical protein JX266_013233 [Neoarthrinium moseri]|nr:hypothetical protein JX266_013233 [Neoarthrinium moseri]
MTHQSSNEALQMRAAEPHQCIREASHECMPMDKTNDDPDPQGQPNDLSEVQSSQHRRRREPENAIPYTMQEYYSDNSGETKDTPTRLQPSLLPDAPFAPQEAIWIGNPVSGASIQQPMNTVGVIFRNLTIEGPRSNASFIRTLPQAIIGSFGPDLFRSITDWIPKLQFGRRQDLQTLINDFTGVAKPGEMMLVLGRPGSGSSTLLQVLANKPASYVSVRGQVSYGSITAENMSTEAHRGEVIYNAEYDHHIPNLTVAQTVRLPFLTSMSSMGAKDVADSLLRMCAIHHRKDVVVGNEFIRGVSGGERKRVSIAETLAVKSAVTCWDNSTRGLDASTALAYAHSLRAITNSSGRTTIATLYQASESIYALMDKVLVVDEGRMLYQGAASEARQYFENLGFYASSQQTTSEFLTSLCDVAARRFREGYEHRCPKTATELERAFRASHAYEKLMQDVADYELSLATNGRTDGSEPMPSKPGSFYQQVLACARRELWLVAADKTELYTKYFTIISNGLIVSSMLYRSPASTDGVFLRSGVAFFSIVFLGWLQLTELIKAVSGRVVIARHHEYGFYRPSAVSFARALVDIPLLLPQVVLFGVIVYFMTGLDLVPAKFFTYLLLSYTTTICFTTMYRMMAAISHTMDDAVRFCGSLLNILLIYAGYVIERPILLKQKIWFGWIAYVNPLSYAFEAVLSNEFAGRTMRCAFSQIVPRGPDIQPQNQACTIAGAHPGSSVVLGDEYLSLKYDYSREHLWRNFGIVVAFIAFYLIITVAATELFTFARAGSGGGLRFKPTKRSKQVKFSKTADEEKGSSPGALSMEEPIDACLPGASVEDLPRSENAITWENINYSVSTPQGSRLILNNVSGYAKPGVLVALMGASGAGKTTLLNTLSRRHLHGVFSGEILVGGQPLEANFQRSTGYVEQMDLHDETATVREAFEFSALLRQSHHIPRQEKLEYVDKVLELLMLLDLQDAVISSLGIEQKKRVTIGVELSAKPSLVFLDEPTSGLDSQSAFSIVRLLRRLCDAGQAVVCTIHQPSAHLIRNFDEILALSPNGSVFYSGPIGSDCSTIIKYFADRGAYCPSDRNVAEFLLETAEVGHPDWIKEWRESAESKAIDDEIQRIKTAGRNDPLDGTQPKQVTPAAFTAAISTQTYYLTKRMLVHQWREPSYIYGRLFTSFVMGIFNGFTFWKLGDSIADMQNRMFSSFLITLIPAAVLNAVLPKFFFDRALWEAREHPSRTYGWIALCTAEVISEVPGSLIAGAVYWLLWYLPTGMPYDAPTAGYVFLMTLLFFLFQSSWGQWICAWAPNFTVISNVLPFFLTVVSLFNGVVVPYDQLDVFWKYWLYWLNPSTYWISGVLASTLSSQSVHCTETEAAFFNPPAGQTCLEFAGTFVQEAGRGYLTDLDATSNCGYCPYASGTEYLATLSIRADQKWRDCGVFLIFCFSNWA